MKFDLGGTTRNKEHKSVNLTGNVDIKANILELDSFCSDCSVDEFLMRHTYEHINICDIPAFLKNVYRKLKLGGKLRIIHTDAFKVIEMYKKNEIHFRGVRDILFTGYYSRISGCINGTDLQGHKYMWGIEDLKEELLFYGFSKVNNFDAGSWKFDFKSYFPNDNHEKYHNIRIPNLGIEATK